MSKPGPGIRRIIKKYAITLQRLAYDREDSEIIGGIAQPLAPLYQNIKMHVQPIGNGDLIEDLPEGQRQRDVKKGWTLETINKKDQILIGDIIYTVNAIQEWPESGHTECDLLRTGERDNIDTTTEFAIVSEDGNLVLSEDSFLTVSDGA